MKSVYSAVRTGSLNKAVCASALKVKAQRIKWLGHIQRMDQARPTGKLLDWRPMGTRPVGRPRQRWQEDVKEYLKKLKVKKLEGDS